MVSLYGTPLPVRGDYSSRGRCWSSNACVPLLRHAAALPRPCDSSRRVRARARARVRVTPTTCGRHARDGSGAASGCRGSCGGAATSRHSICDRSLPPPETARSSELRKVRVGLGSGLDGKEGYGGEVRAVARGEAVRCVLDHAPGWGGDACGARRVEELEASEVVRSKHELAWLGLGLGARVRARLTIVGAVRCVDVAAIGAVRPHTEYWEAEHACPGRPRSIGDEAPRLRHPLARGHLPTERLPRRTVGE
eukprot:scaffold2912_cov68-Phaeocystis_antarctica.AAC.6